MTDGAVPSGEPDSKVPPTDRDRLVLFVSSVDDYESLEEAFPLGPVVAFEDDPVQRWKLVARAMLIRKYIARRDQLFLGRVWDSFVAVSGAGDGTEDQIAANRARLIDLEGHVGFGTDAGSGRPRDEFQMLDDFLYGRYLHGDWGKWKRSVELGQMETVALVTVLQAIEARADQLAQWCRQLLEATVDTGPDTTAIDGDPPAT